MTIQDPADYLRKSRRGAMFIIDGPSGSGKNAIIKGLIAQDKNLKFSVSVTTRAKREMEVEGVDYYFVTQEKYDQLLKEDAFYEHVAIDYGHCYGTLRSEVDEFLIVGQDVLFDTEFEGAMQILKKAPNDVVTIGLFPPTVKTLYDRLLKRGDNIETINKRMKQLVKRFGQWDKYDYVVFNINLDEAIGKVQRIISGERMKRVRQIGLGDIMAELIAEAKDVVK